MRRSRWPSSLRRVVLGLVSLVSACTGYIRTPSNVSPVNGTSYEIDLSKRFKRLARDKGKQVVILHRHPMLTSARKMDLYSAGERLRFLAKAIFMGARISRNREDCSIWYDGRR